MNDNAPVFSRQKYQGYIEETLPSSSKNPFVKMVSYIFLNFLIIINTIILKFSFFVVIMLTSISDIFIGSHCVWHSNFPKLHAFIGLTSIQAFSFVNCRHYYFEYIINSYCVSIQAQPPFLHNLLYNTTVQEFSILTQTFCPSNFLYNQPNYISCHHDSKYNAFFLPLFLALSFCLSFSLRYTIHKFIDTYQLWLTLSPLLVYFIWNIS